MGPIDCIKIHKNGFSDDIIPIFFLFYCKGKAFCDRQSHFYNFSPQGIERIDKVKQAQRVLTRRATSQACGETSKASTN